MKNIDRFILHVVHNLFPLNEYAPKILNFLLTKYREEADDLNINISDNQLKKYIDRFEQMKSSLIAKGGTDLIKQIGTDQYEILIPLSKLIKTVTSGPNAELDKEEEEEDQTPDVVYNNDGIIIYNGSKENNCITYGRGERWCITRGMYGNYRYSPNSKYPTFYLAKNNNLPDSDRTSFVAIQVREDGSYAISLRPNDGDKNNLTWEQMLSYAPWLREIPNLKNILKYIPLSNTEKMTQKYKNSPVSVREWMAMPYAYKQSYLVVRSAGKKFSDISDEEFVEKYLPKYPQIAKFIAITPGLFNINTLLKNLDKFSNQDRRSIVANFRNKIQLNLLQSDEFPFDVKKLLVTLDKWALTPEQRLYVTKDGNNIVLLTLSDDIKIGIFQEEDDFPNIKLNQRTAKYLLEYPELDKLPFKLLLDLSLEGVVSKDIIQTILDNAKSDPNSGIKVKQIGNNQILLDSNTLSSYKIEGDKINKVPFNNEDVQKAFEEEKENEGFQDNVIKIVNDAILNRNSLPPLIDKDALLGTIKATPYNKRLTGDGGIILVPEGGEHSLVIKKVQVNLEMTAYGNGADWRSFKGDYGYTISEEDWKAYFAYLRATNSVYNDVALIRTLENRPSQNATKENFIKAKPPLDPNGNYFTAVVDGKYLVINKQNPSQSKGISPNSGKLVKANVPASVATRLQNAGAPGQPAAAAPAAPIAGVPRRGRPAGVPNAVRAPQPPAAPAGAAQTLGVITNQYNLTPGFNTIGRQLRRFNMPGAPMPLVNNRGVSRRNNILGNAGRVVASYDFGPSSIYIIRLANNTVVASVVIQPGNSHWLVTSQNSYALNSPADLLQALQQRNLAEAHQYLVNEYMDRNPHHLTEFRQILRQHINEKKKQNENK